MVVNMLENNVDNAFSTLKLFRNTVSYLASGDGHDVSIVSAINLRYAGFILHNQEAI